MNVKQAIDYLSDYDENEEIQVEVRFDDAGESYASTFSVTTFSHDEVSTGKHNSWPTIRANIGFGTMTEEELDLLIECVEGISQRLRHYRNGA